MTTLSNELVAEGYPVEFVVLSNANASDFISLTHRPIFKDGQAGQPAWQEMEPGAVKHDTFIYSKTGERLMFWDASSNSLGTWSADIRAAVVAQGQ